MKNELLTRSESGEDREGQSMRNCFPPSLTLLRQGLSMNLEELGQWHLLHSAGVRGMSHHVQLFLWMLRIQAEDYMFVLRALSHLPIFYTRNSHVLKTKKASVLTSNQVFTDSVLQTRLQALPQTGFMTWASNTHLPLSFVIKESLGFFFQNPG